MRRIPDACSRSSRRCHQPRITGDDRRRSNSHASTGRTKTNRVWSLVAPLALSWATKRLTITVAAFLTIAGCSMGDAPLPPAPAPDTLRIATHNVHYIWLGRETGPWSVGDWENRKESLDLAFKALDADIIGFQEMESFARGSVQPVNLTLDWLVQRNPDYRIAAANDPAVFPSTQPILYRPARLRAVDEGWFFFSDTPDTLYSRTFNGSFPAFASWATFEDRETTRTFTVVNVHFDFSSGSNRLKSAELVAGRIRPRIEAGETVFVIGDINASAASRTARIIRETGLTFTPVNGSTYHWNRGLNVTPAIDHLTATPDVEATGDAIILRRQFDDDWPSDHYPVLADFRWK